MVGIRFASLGRELTIRTRGLSAAEIKRELVIRARRESAKVVRDHIARSGVAPAVEIAVNGRRGVAEEQVILPGPIVYTFRIGSEIANYLVAFLFKRSPKKTGLYARRHRVIVRGSWSEPNAVGASPSFIVVNTEPFSRKLEVGGMRARVPPHIYEDARQAAQARYGRIATFNLRYIELAGGYILKGKQRTRAAKRSARSSVRRAGGSTLSARKDLRVGEPMRYPSIHVEMR